MRSWLTICLLSNGCAYRFTNQFVTLPPGVRSIAVEAVYDTSREVLPHEIMWEALQRSLAQDGHFQIVSQGSADALVRAHITKADDLPVGNAEKNGPDRDVKRSRSSDFSVEDFRHLPEAGEFTTRQSLSVGVDVEVINLATQEIIFKRQYTRTKEFRSFRSETSVVQKKSHFLFFEEARTAKFRELSRDVADSFVRDFVVGR